MIAALEALDRRFDLSMIDTSNKELRAMKISGGGMLALLSTHPPLPQRIAALRAAN